MIELFRIPPDLAATAWRDIAPLLASPDPTVVLKGVVEYQVCSDTLCHPPGSLPVTWSLRVRPLDRERAPEALRRPIKP